MIEKVREIIRKEAGERDWKLHVSLVVKYAKELAKIYNESEEIAELAALLHDIGFFRYGDENHEITGSRDAGIILREHGYSEEIIKQVEHCIKTHRASGKNHPETKIAEIIRDADALSHFDVFPLLIQFGLEKFDNDTEKAVKWVSDKLDRDWNNKMHLPESKKIGEEKYKAAKLLLDATRDCFSGKK